MNSIDSKAHREIADRILRRMLPYYLLITYLGTAMWGILFYFQHHRWVMSDWLINYSGGFVRRGFLGQIALMLSHASLVDPGLISLFVQLICYGVFFYYSYALLRTERSLLPWIFLIFSPYIFAFQLHDPESGFRKEIIYFALLSFVAWARKEVICVQFERLFLVALLLYPMLILSHEMLVIFVPYLLVVFFRRKQIKERSLLCVGLAVILCLSSFLLACVFRGSLLHERAIWNSLETSYPMGSGGAIGSLHLSPRDQVRIICNGLTTSFIGVSIAQIGLSLVAFIPVRGRVIALLSNRICVALVCCGVFGSIALCLVATDWGRFIYINLVSLFILSLLSTSPQEQLRELEATSIGRPVSGVLWSSGKCGLYAIFFFIWSQAWRIGGFPQKVSEFNVVSYLKPFVHMYQATHGN